MEKRMMGPKPEKTTFCSKRSALGGSGAEGEGGAEGVGAAGLEYLSSSGCSSLGNVEKSGELCRDETAQRGKWNYSWSPDLRPPHPPPPRPRNCSSWRELWSGAGEDWVPVPALPLPLCLGMNVSPAHTAFPCMIKGKENSCPADLTGL